MNATKTARFWPNLNYIGEKWNIFRSSHSPRWQFVCRATRSSSISKTAPYAFCRFRTVRYAEYFLRLFVLSVNLLVWRRKSLIRLDYSILRFNWTEQALSNAAVGQFQNIFAVALWWHTGFILAQLLFRSNRRHTRCCYANFCKNPSWKCIFLHLFFPTNILSKSANVQILLPCDENTNEGSNKKEQIIRMPGLALTISSISSANKFIVCIQVWFVVVHDDSSSSNSFCLYFCIRTH